MPDDALPPGEIRFSEFLVEPWPDGRCLRVHLTLTPFQKNPNLDGILTDDGEQYRLSATISYPGIGVVDQQSISLWNGCTSEIRQSTNGEA